MITFATACMAAIAASAARSVASAERPIRIRLPPPTAPLVRPVVPSQTNSPSMTGMRQMCLSSNRFEICQPSPK